ncbi:hypothetical protein A6A08_05130 [Nocardiopsis sp. TSRI0078]|nr:alpha/beta hydrolase [Nocardiopsis sp. TSRI0078]OKI19158.1 hypothetical protein A6A08_05130 [Nocardiopsis sp. TSRI0078]
MSSGLPPDIDADVPAINSGADALDRICATMYGRAEGLDGQFNGAANEFTDLIAWDISTASAKDLMSWQEAGSALTHGAAVLRLWGEDIEAYREVRTELLERWERAKVDAQARVDHPIADATASGVTGGLAAGIFDAVTNSEAEREAQEVMALNGLSCELIVEHNAAWEVLMDQADQVKKDLRNGPSEQTMERLVEAGHLSWNHAGFLPAGDLPLEEFTENADPGAVSTWWNSLSEAERDAAMNEHPEILRDLDGIPATVRDELNREHLEDEIERAEEEVERLEEEAAEIIEDRSGGERTFDEDVDPKLFPDLAQAREDRDVLKELRESLDNENKEEGEEDKFLLALDPTGETGRAIVAVGNPDTADNVGTLVPGTNTTWQSIGTQMDRAEWLQQSTDLAASEGTANSVIAWIGYDTPKNAGAASPTYAENATDPLSSFQEGLRATHEGEPSNNTVIGHSYGTTVVGHTAQSAGGIDADELVFVGSPGVNADHVSELGFDPDDVHASTAANDNISFTTGSVHGEDPTSEEFGATQFPSNTGSEFEIKNFPLGAAHSEYFKVDSKSWAYMGEVIAGQH